MTTPDTGEQNPFRKYFEEFEAEWSERLGQTGTALRRDLQKLTDLLLIETREVAREQIRELVASWALSGSEEVIPMEKWDKEGVLRMASNRDFISDGELLELVRMRFPDG